MLFRSDYARFRRIRREVFLTTFTLLRTYRRLKREYRAAYPTMVGDAYWRDQFARS